MSSAPSPPSPHLGATRVHSIRHVPGIASLPSFASSTSHDSCNAVQSGAGRCNPKDAAMTQPMTQTQAACCRNDASRRDGRHAPRRPVPEDERPCRCLARFRPRCAAFAPVAFLRGLATKVRRPNPATTWPPCGDDGRSVGTSWPCGKWTPAGTSARRDRVCFACTVS